VPIISPDLSTVYTDPALEGRLQLFLDLLLDWNTRLNLISRKETAPWIHLQDSLHFAAMLPQGQSLIDIGTGAGFPGLIVALARPDLQVTLVEPQRKKQAFLEAAAALLHLGVDRLEARVEGGVVRATQSPKVWLGRWDNAVCKALVDTAGFARMAGPLARTLWFFASEEQAQDADPRWTVARRWTVEDSRPRVLLTTPGKR
jgi:16S rRNA (guanine(527)-N(7))-methyltransferase RsmG